MSAVCRCGCRVSRLERCPATGRVTSLELEAGERLEVGEGEVVILAAGVRSPELGRQVAVTWLPGGAV